MSKQIYLDYAAATPMDPKVLEAMQPYLSREFYNPSATYLAGRKIKQDISRARSAVAGWLGAKPAEIIFTSGGTEANNLALFGTAIAHEEAEIISTAIEHESVLAPLRYLSSHGWPHRLVKPNAKGIVEPSTVAEAVTDKTLIVSVMYVNNEVGAIQPIKEISAQLAQIRRRRLAKGNKLPLYLHTDACQAATCLDLHTNRLGVDLMTINGGKIYGPKGSGVLFVSSRVAIEPIIFGGGQERGVRSGTENTAGIMGLAAALDITQKLRQAEARRLKDLSNLFIRELDQKIPQAIANGSGKHYSPHLLHISFPGYDNERLMMQLDEAGVQCGVGSACSASDEDPSHVLKAMGMSDELARSSLRFSFGRGTTSGSIKYVAGLLEELVTK